MTGESVNVVLIQGILLGFLVVAILMPGYIRLVRWAGFAKQIRIEGPEGHLSKAGTPTAGGALMIAVVGALSLLLNLVDASTFAPLATLGLVGALGLADDWLNARTGDGIRARHKLLWQVVVAVFVAWQIQKTYDISSVAVPFVGAVPIAPWLYIAFAAFSIVAMSNGVNLTDGLDGLAGGTLVFAFVPFLIIALLNPPPVEQENLAVLCALMIGSLLGFLWFNVHPAQIFMGDAGSLSIGAMLAVVSLMTGQILILPLIGIVFVLEVLSDIIQIGYFKMSHGKRIFRMAPLHHHFELGGWPETKITLRFWIVGGLAGLLGVTLFLATWQRLP
jgi:phospho-N-acetylmuramoyl-pentapeptide-transferase